MTTKRFSAKELAELEGDYAPLAGAPRHLVAKPTVPELAFQLLAISSVRCTVLEALLATGYAPELAEKMADELAASVPRVEETLRATG